MCALLVDLPEVKVLGVEDVDGGPLRVVVELEIGPQACPCCGGGVRVKDRPVIEHVDLPCFGRPTRLVWRKHRLCCARGCGQATWTMHDDRVAPARCTMTTRAGRWATRQVGRHGRTVAEVARELGCDWHTVNDAVIGYGEALLDDGDGERLGAPTAIGMDELLVVRRGDKRIKVWATAIVDVRDSRLLDLVEGRDHRPGVAWLRAQPPGWLAAIAHVTLDLSGPYRKVFDTALPDAIQVADPFHVVKVAQGALDACRRRVQNDTLGHRGRKGDPLYRCRRLLAMAAERLDEGAHAKLTGLIRAGDRHGQVAYAWHAKEVVRDIYTHADTATATAWVDAIVRDFADTEMPPEVRRLGRTIARWKHQILAWHDAQVTNGPTESMNNLAKRIKRVAFGFRSFRHFRVRSLLYAGQPNWDRLDTITPR